LKEVQAASPNDRKVLRDRIELAELQARLDYGSRDLKALDQKITEMVGLLATYESSATNELAEWQFLGKIYEYMAISARELSRMELRMRFARRSVELRQKAAEQDKSRLAKAQLSTALSAHAGLLRATGDLTGAIEVLLQSLAVMEQIAADDPNDY